jgi:hypothetical protein
MSISPKFNPRSFLQGLGASVFIAGMQAAFPLPSWARTEKWGLAGDYGRYSELSAHVSLFPRVCSVRRDYLESKGRRNCAQY